MLKHVHFCILLYTFVYKNANAPPKNLCPTQIENSHPVLDQHPAPPKIDFSETNFAPPDSGWGSELWKPYISRTGNAIENPIWYSESTENSLSGTSDQIFAYLSSSGRKIDLKMGYFHAFLSLFWVVLGHFLDNYFRDFDQTCWKVRQNGYKAGAKDRRVKFWAIVEIFRLKDG